MPTHDKPEDAVPVPIAELPLAEVSYEAVEEALESNPRELTDADLDRIVAFMRAHREAWQEEENNPSGSGGGKRRKLKVNLEELDLDI